MADSLVLTGVKDIKKHAGTEMLRLNPKHGGDTFHLKRWWVEGGVSTVYVDCTVFDVTTAAGTVKLALATNMSTNIRIDHDGSFNFTFIGINEISRGALYTDDFELIEHYVFPDISGGKTMTVTPAGGASRPGGGSSGGDTDTWTGVVDPTGDPIGSPTANFPATALVGSSIEVAISRTGSNGHWGAALTSSDPDDVIITTGGGDPNGDPNTSGYKKITFSNTLGVHTLTVTLTSPPGPIAAENGDPGAPDTPSIETYDVEVVPVPAPVTFTLTGVGAGNANYETSQGDNASISIPRGTVLTIVNNSGGHPVVISSDAGSINEMTSGVTGSPAGDGASLVWDTGANYIYSSTYYYTCSSHPSTMYGQITLT
jgi:plastocyanin